MTGEQAGQVGRIPPSGFRQLGPINWVIAKLAARQVRAPEMHLFTTLGQRRLLFWAWSIYGTPAVDAGDCPRIDTELVILRVAHLRACEYELQHHRRMARKAGLGCGHAGRDFRLARVCRNEAGETAQRPAAGAVAGDR